MNKNLESDEKKIQIKILFEQPIKLIVASLCYLELQLRFTKMPEIKESLY